MFLFNNFKLPYLNYYKNVLVTYYIKIYFVMSTDYNYGLKTRTDYFDRIRFTVAWYCF